jgi:hypothetical protein
VGPVAEEVHALIGFEYLSVGLEVARIDRLEVTGDMTSIVSSKVGRGVESVVVTRREIDDEIHDFVASSFGSLKLLVTDSEARVGLAAEEELVKSVVVALDALESTVLGINFTNAENCTIAWRAQRAWVFLIRNWARIGLKLPREECVEGREVVQVLHDSLVELNVVHRTEGLVESSSEIGRQVRVAE